ncbi:hypothetical protein BYT27DRAFT_7161728 [Phlegmacium glaucopus]|nr:hypothetical protein BYT27DRAFT_7161728 [Phlegmacium glaucopus]
MTMIHPGTCLPQEIIDLILDSVAESDSDYSSLCSCSLVSKSFSYRSRYHLFGDIFISADENEMFEILQSFRDILSSKQAVVGRTLLHFIKCFEIELRTEKYLEPKLSEEMDSVLVQIMRALHEPNYGVNQFSLAVTRREKGDQAMDWANLSSEFHRSFLDLTHSPHLSILDLDHFYNVPNTLLNGTHIKELFLYSITFSPSDISHNTQFSPELSNSDISSLPIPQLEAFSTDHPSTICDLNGGTTDLSFLCSLKRFDTFMDFSEDIDPGWKVMAAAASSLEYFHIDFYDEFPVFKEPFDLSCLTQLRTLGISYWRFTPPDLDTSVPHLDLGVEQICHILRIPSPAQSLNSLVIDIKTWQVNPPVFDGIKFEDVHPGFEKSSLWLMLDSLLTGPRYPSLRKLEIALNVQVKMRFAENFEVEIFNRETRRYFSMVLPALSASKSVTFTLDLIARLDTWDDDEEV